MDFESTSNSIFKKTLSDPSTYSLGKGKELRNRIWFSLDDIFSLLFVRRRGEEGGTGGGLVFRLIERRYEHFLVFPIPSFAFSVMHRHANIGEHGSRVVLSTPVLLPLGTRDNGSFVAGSRESNYSRLRKKSLVTKEIDARTMPWKIATSLWRIFNLIKD